MTSDTMRYTLRLGVVVGVEGSTDESFFALQGLGEGKAFISGAVGRLPI